MTQLQILAVRRIETLVRSIDCKMTAYALYRDKLTPEEAKAKDKENSDQWSVNNTAQREAVEWTQALLAETEDDE